MPNGPVFVATWKFGQAVADKAISIARDGHSMLDAVERGIWVAELDATNSTVGYGGTPNENGDVELDACIMSGPGHQAGAVAGLQGISHPISVARKVMTDTPHVMLVGQGAQDFAVRSGFDKEDLLTENERKKYQAWKAKQSESVAPHADGQAIPGQPSDQKKDLGATQPISFHDDHKESSNDGRNHDLHHDTIALIGIDENGDLYGGCSTSGWGYKLAGRVGDSPIIGSGLYVDNQIGAVGSTGTGENVMRYCASFWITQLMGQGLSPVDACEKVIREIARKDPQTIDQLAINFIAINKDGVAGAAGTSRGFQYAVASLEDSRMLQPRLISRYQ